LQDFDERAARRGGADPCAARRRMEMSRMNEITSKEPVVEPQLPAKIEGETAAFMRAIASGSRVTLLGTLLLFKKGAWEKGENREKLEEGTRAIALMNEARHGYVFWPNNEKPVYLGGKIGKLSEGFEVPDRQTLGNLDKERWPIGLSGQREDPWRHSIFLPMQLVSDDEVILTFISNSEGGRSAFYYLAKRYAWLGRKHIGQYPVLKLGVEEYIHKKYGKQTKPRLEIDGWAGRPDVSLVDDLGDGGEVETELPPRRDDLSDDIPF
jgi:hypothetical protein